jgi:hypothetical protein
VGVVGGWLDIGQIKDPMVASLPKEELTSMIG